MCWSHSSFVFLLILFTASTGSVVFLPFKYKENDEEKVIRCVIQDSTLVMKAPGVIIVISSFLFDWLMKFLNFALIIQKDIGSKQAPLKTTEFSLSELTPTTQKGVQSLDSARLTSSDSEKDG